MKLLMPMLAALLAANLVAQSLDSAPSLNDPALSTVPDNKVLGSAPVDLSPQAVGDSFKCVGQNELIVAAPGVLANDSGENLLAMLLYQEKPIEQGTLTLLKDGGFTYQPLPGFVGEDIFFYQALDSNGVIAKAQITIVCVEEEGTQPLVILEAPGTPGTDAADEAASCSAVAGSAPWLLLPMIGLALMRFRRARA